jgi:SepF-like predicted cell division protein (DUF552 family)
MDSMQTQKTPIYLKAITLRDMSDVASIKDDAKKQTILILRVTPLAQNYTDMFSQLVAILRGWERNGLY